MPGRDFGMTEKHAQVVIQRLRDERRPKSENV
jgi:hypothetical protein